MTEISFYNIPNNPILTAEFVKNYNRPTKRAYLGGNLDRVVRNAMKRLTQRKDRKSLLK